jgi:hypothetical protein
MTEPDDDAPLAVVLQSAAEYDGGGWYYYDVEMPEEGSVGAFSTRQEAEDHAKAGGYRVGEE